MVNEGLFFSETNFEKLFPFYVRLNNDLKIIGFGPSLQKLLGNIEGRPMSETFKFIRPQMSIQMNFESMKAHLDNVIILESIESPLKLRFRGQFIFMEKGNEILYLNSPWLMDISEIKFHNLLISDFAIHETVVDNLQLLQSKQLVNEEMKIIADELVKQRNELTEKNEKIIELARFPDQDPQPILRMDFEGHILYANKHAVELIENYDFMEKFFWKSIYHKFETNNFLPFEKEIKLGDKIMFATIVPFREKSYFNVYLRDITETILFQNELVTTSSRLYSLINTMQSAVLAENTNREIILVNQNFCDLFEIPLSPEMMKGMDFTKSAEQTKHFFENEDNFVNDLNSILERKTAVFGEVLIMKSGKILERDYIPIFENEQYIGHIWKYQDITLIVNSKESLRKIEDKYSRIIENLKFGLIEVDLDEIITKAFPAFCELTGYSEKELLGFNARDLFANDENLNELDSNMKLREEGKSSVYEIQLKTKSGDRKWVIVSGSPIFNENNEITGTLGIHLDITDRKKLEDDLIKANEIANSSVKAKEIFLANMSHEIRTPMNVIIGMSDLLNDSELTDEQRNFLTAINHSSQNLLNLINDILDFSKIEAGELIIEESEINLYDLIDVLSIGLGHSANEKGISYLQKIDSKVSKSLLGDANKINQVLLNLVSNAIKFTNVGTVNLNIELVHETELEQHVKFIIVDTGVGILSENFDSIFQTFKQEDSSISRKFGGTGLGLSISKGIVEKMNSEIELTSEKNAGSTFSFTLVLKKNISIISSHKNDIIFKNDLIRTVNILVAEDNPMNQMLIKAILEKEKIKYNLVSNGKEAIECLGENKYDLILMDIQMPIMDGVTATEYIRKKMNLNIPIIALTANVSNDDKQKFASAGMDGHISKPYKREELLEKIINLTSQEMKNTLPKNSIDQSANHDVKYSMKNIQAIAEGDESFIISIIETLCIELPKYLKEIQNGIEILNIVSVKKAAHQLKPTIDILEIEELKQTIRDLEEECEKDFPEVQKMQNQFKLIDQIVRAVILDLNAKK